jgi:predicted acylesterase/phospholipase RssA
MRRIRRHASRKIGLALAGGGPEGAVYEIGALRALEEALGGIDFNDLDSYVGVSAGSFVAALLANDIPVSQLVRMIVTHEPDEQPFHFEKFFAPAYGEIAKRGLMLPGLIAESIVKFAQKPGDQSLREAFTRLGRAIPVGLFDNDPIRAYLERTFTRKHRTNDFRKLRNKLIVVAADLDSGRPVLFGGKDWDHVPISLAVQASTALPGLYPPVKIDGSDCVDGVLLRTVHASVAFEQGVELLLCVNPIVPTDVRQAVGQGLMPRGILTRRGLPSVLSQTFRTLIHSRLEVGLSRYATHFPGADLVLFEPGRDEYAMFFSNMFSFSSRREVCELAYRHTRRELWTRRRVLEPLLKKHGVTLRLDVLRDETRSVWESAGISTKRRAGVTAKLDRALAALEDAERATTGNGKRPGARKRGATSKRAAAAGGPSASK